MAFTEYAERTLIYSLWLFDAYIFWCILLWLFQVARRRLLNAKSRPGPILRFWLLSHVIEKKFKIETIRGMKTHSKLVSPMCRNFSPFVTDPPGAEIQLYRKNEIYPMAADGPTPYHARLS